MQSFQVKLDDDVLVAISGPKAETSAFEYAMRYRKEGKATVMRWDKGTKWVKHAVFHKWTEEPQ